MEQRPSVPPYLGLGDKAVAGPPSGGGWTTPHVRHRTAAHRMLAEVLVLAEQVERWGKIIREDRPAARRAIGQILTSSEKLETTAECVAIYSAMTVEAATNLYGVVLLGQEFFRAHLERLGAIPKLVTLLLAGAQVVVANDAEVLAILRGLHAKRNQYVHPKARELTDSEWRKASLTASQRAAESQEAIKQMERFLELLVAYDPRIRPFI